MIYLTKSVETYRLPDEEAVEKFLQELKNDSRFELTKYSSQKKDIKAKGEIWESYIKVEVTKTFNDEKTPDREITIDYLIEE